MGKPPWLKIEIRTDDKFLKVKSAVKELKLNTVCEEARCPNMFECWSGGTATFMLMGDVCTRGCRFCHIKSGKPLPLDKEEPRKLAEALKRLNLDYIVLTSVDRDDLPDGGADHIAESIKRIKKEIPSLLVEVLIPDFRGDINSIKKVANAGPDVIAHNIETVKSLQRTARDVRASYGQSLFVLDFVKKFSEKIHTKSSLMLGLGETEKEVIQTMQDLREARVEILTLGQYLRPSMWHLEVKEYVTPETFEKYNKIAEGMGFLYVASGPLVRSSYRAGELFLKNILIKDQYNDGNHA